MSAILLAALLTGTLLQEPVPDKVGKLFMDQSKTVAAGKEWSIQLTRKDFIGGWIKHRIDSPGSFTLTLATQEGYDLLQKQRKGQKVKIWDGDILRKETHQRLWSTWTGTWRDGAHWLLIRNNSKRPARIRVRCWWPDYGASSVPRTNGGSFTMVRNGMCLKCDTCGETSGCS
jgi:hypothetical protein